MPDAIFGDPRLGYRAWLEWAADDRPVTLDVPGIGPVWRRLEVTGVEIASDSTLRFRDRDEVEASLAACGYRVQDVREAPDRPGREFVVIARSGR